MVIGMSGARGDWYVCHSWRLVSLPIMAIGTSADHGDWYVCWSWRLVRLPLMVIDKMPCMNRAIIAMWTLFPCLWLGLYVISLLSGRISTRNLVLAFRSHWCLTLTLLFFSCNNNSRAPNSIKVVLIGNDSFYNLVCIVLNKHSFSKMTNAAVTAVQHSYWSVRAMILYYW